MAGPRLDLFGFERLRERLKPGSFARRLERNVKVATIRVGLIAERKIKTDISQGKVKPSKLSRLTIKIKGSSRALVDTGELRKSIVSRVEAWDTVIVGVLKRRNVTSEIGNTYDVMDIAVALHFGATITVTDKMRRYFFWLANGSNSPLVGQIKPLSPQTKVLRIPPRPFMKGVFDPRMTKQYKDIWQAAVNKTMAGD